MKLVRIRPPSWAALCVRCGRLAAWADLDGKPFQDYYCDKCADQLRQKGVTT